MSHSTHLSIYAATDANPTAVTVLHILPLTDMLLFLQCYTAADTHDCTPAGRVTLLLIQMTVLLLAELHCC